MNTECCFVKCEYGLIDCAQQLQYIVEIVQSGKQLSSEKFIVQH
jgi:hypothetical protein